MNARSAVPAPASASTVRSLPAWLSAFSSMDASSSVPSTPIATPAKNATDDGGTLASTTDSKGGTAGSKQLTRDQLLEYIKKQKVVIKRLEKEKEKEILTKKELDNAPPVKPAAADTDTIPHPNHICGVQRAVEEAPGSASECDRGVLRKMIIRNIADSFLNSELGRRSIPTKKSIFLLWKHKSTLQGVARSVHRHYEDAKVKMTELEQKNAKLKSLLARSHQVNQRNAEDSSNLKKAQREALTELKNMKQKDESEKFALLESLRVQNIQSAFHNDIELSIQKAAEELLLQQKLILTQQQQQQQHILSEHSSSSGNTSTPLRLSNSNGSSKVTPSSSSSSSYSIEALEQSLREKEAGISELVSKSSILASDTERYKKDISNLNHVLDTVNGKLSTSELKNEDLLRKVEEQKSVIGELEVEIEITLSNRAKIVTELESIAENNANKRFDVIQKELEVCCLKIVNLEKRVLSLTDECNRLSSENERLQSSNSNYISQTAELERLKVSVSDIKIRYLRSAGLGQVITKAAKDRDSNHPLVAAVNSIIEISLDSAHKCIEYSDNIASLERQVLYLSAKYKFEVPYLWSLCSGLLAVMQERVSSRCQGGQNGKSLVEQLDVINARLHSAQLGGMAKSKTATQPLVFETSAVTIIPGKDLSIPVIVGAGDVGATNEVVLEWRYYGDGSHQAVIALLDGSDEIPLGSFSTASNGNKEFSGKYIIRSVAGGGRPKSRIFRIRNPTWGQIILGYNIQLKTVGGVGDAVESTSESSDVARLTLLRDDVTSMLGKGNTLYDKFIDATRQALHTYKLSQRASLADVYSSGSSIEAIRAQVAVQEACRTNLQKLQKVVSIANSHMNRSSSSSTSHDLSSPHSSSSSKSAALEQPVDASFSCDSVIVKAADELRVAIPADLTQGTFSLTYEFSLNTARGKKSNNYAAPSSSSSSSSGVSEKRSSLDIGFSVLENLPDGSFRQIVGYRRVGADGAANSIVLNRDGVSSDSRSSVVFLFDNTYSYLRSKDIKYSIRVESIRVTSTVADSSYADTGVGGFYAGVEEDDNVGTAVVAPEPDDISDNLMQMCHEVMDYVSSADALARMVRRGD